MGIAKSANGKYLVFKYYVAFAPAYKTAFESLPPKTIVSKMKKSNEEAVARTQNEQNLKTNKDNVEQTKSLEDLKGV